MTSHMNLPIYILIDWTIIFLKIKTKFITIDTFKNYEKKNKTKFK